MDNLFGDLRFGARRRSRATACQAAAEYVGRWGWAVALGGPDGSVLLAVGRRFDLLDVPEQAGLRALVRLERMGTQVGPVLAAPTGRLFFFVARGTAELLPDLLYRMGWDDAELDLRCLGAGDHVTAPPSDLSGLGPVRWLREPLLDSAAHPPEARLLLGTLAYVCHRDRSYA